MTLGAGARAEIHDLDPVIGEIPAIADPGRIEEARRGAQPRRDCTGEGAHTPAVDRGGKTVGAGQELDRDRPSRFSGRFDCRPQLGERGFDRLVRQQAAVDLKRTGGGHDVGVVAAADQPDAHGRSLVPGNALGQGRR